MPSVVENAFLDNLHRQAGAAGDRLACELGPCERTLRHVDLQERLSGLSGAEENLFWEFHRVLGVEPDEIHTDVAVGQVEALPEDKRFPGSDRLVGRVYPWRVDVALRFGSRWWLVECKQRASHYVLGQAACYFCCWCRDCKSCRVDRVVVVTDWCSDDVKWVARAMGIDVVEMFGDLKP